nr:MAG TPA: hypothetical protein [Inoviridae sp.]
MTIFDELSQILGSGVSDYPFLLAFSAVVIFCFICIEFMGVISAIFKHLGGWR